ncbi:MAG TPA: TetR/AcrR family transcriptional regulator [Solirubrobacteraceae bacterium]|nr:TetR/AcrR family transcriptional regulator [Solirubrobacteraceae bacterium]
MPMNSHLKGKGSKGQLPRGPHGLTPEEVEADQRSRLIDAMVQLVADKGYAATTVGDLIEHAEVSRKTFYTHFDDRHDLMLATFDAVAPAALDEVRAAVEIKGGPTRQLEALMRDLCRIGQARPGVISLSAIEIAALNPVGLERRDQLMSDYGDLLEECLQANDKEHDLPPSLTRALAGSAYRTIDARLRRPQPDLRALGPQLARWARSYDPIPEGFVPEAPPRSRWPGSADGLAGGRAPGTLTLAPSGYRAPVARQTKSFVHHVNRERILDAVAQLVSEMGYVPLTAQAIAERADVSERAFLAHFRSKDDAFVAAVEVGHMKAMAIVSRAREQASDWRSGVRDAVYALIEFLASEPYFTRLAFVDAPLAGPQMAERMHEHVTSYTRLLLDDAPQRRRPSAVAPEAAVHGLFELAFHYTVQHRATELLNVTREAAYLVLAPFVGVSEAAEAAA